MPNIYSSLILNEAEITLVFGSSWLFKDPIKISLDLLRGGYSDSHDPETGTESEVNILSNTRHYMKFVSIWLFLNY